MLEIIALIFITREIGKLAEAKGLKPVKWKIYMVLSWIGLEMLGFIVALMFFSPDNLFSIMMVGLMFAITSYFLIKSKLNSLPDRGIDEDINNLGK